jgi:hypothetical protein
MRRYDIISGILLILSIIDFALAAPVSAQEKRQEIDEMVHISTEDVTTVLGKRWEEDLEKLGEDFLKTGENPVESSDSHPSSSSAPSGPDDHGSTNVVQPPTASNPASSTTNSDPSKDPSSSGCSSSTLTKRGPWARGGCWSVIKPAFIDDDYLNSYYRPSAVSPGGFGMDYAFSTPLLPQRVPEPKPDLTIDPSADPSFDWAHWMNAEDPPTEIQLAETNWHNVDPAHPPSTSGHAPGPPPTAEEDEAVTPPPPDLGSQKEPEYQVDHGTPLSPDNEPEDLQAAIYAAKGKAKVPGTVRDVGNAAQRELHPAERSLDSGE